MGLFETIVIDSEKEKDRDSYQKEDVVKDLNRFINLKDYENK